MLIFLLIFDNVVGVSIHTRTHILSSHRKFHAEEIISMEMLITFLSIISNTFKYCITFSAESDTG